MTDNQNYSGTDNWTDISSPRCICSDITEATDQPDGTRVAFMVDRSIFAADAAYNLQFVERMCRYYCYLNTGLTINLNGRNISSKNGLLDLLKEEMKEEVKEVKEEVKTEE